MLVSRDILEKMQSASHFAREVPMTMTQLAELLETVGDTVFSVQFRKKPNEDQIQKRLKNLTVAQVRADARELTKELIEGEICTMVCRLIQTEQSLGRSTVIDFSAASENKFRQVDHRTIDNIVYKNIRYILKKGGKKMSEDEIVALCNDKDRPKWDYKKL